MSDLHAAVRDNNLEAAGSQLGRWQLFRSSRLAGLDADGHAPIHLANSPAMVDLLVERGADVQMQAGDQATLRTALHLAAERGDCDTVQALLAKGADVNTRDANTDTPLHLAAANAVLPLIVQLLIERGCDVDALNNADASPLVLAILAYPGDEDASEHQRIRDNVLASIGIMRRHNADCSILYEGHTPQELAKHRHCPWVKKVGTGEQYKVTWQE